MSLNVREWLPAEALEGDAVRRLVAEAVGQWAPKWFARSELAASGFEARKGAAPRHPGGWQADRAVATAFSAPETVRLAGLALDAAPERLVLSEADRDIIGRLTATIAADLAAVIDAALGLDPAGTETPGEAEDPFGGDGGLLFSANDGSDRPILHVAIPAAALVASCKAAISPARRCAPLHARLGGAVHATAVRFGARLGSVVLPLGELAGLAVGDILVLDRVIEDGAELALLPSGQPFARGAIVPGDSDVSLLLLPQQGD